MQPQYVDTETMLFGKLSDELSHISEEVRSYQLATFTNIMYHFLLVTFLLYTIFHSIYLARQISENISLFYKHYMLIKYDLIQHSSKIAGV